MLVCCKEVIRAEPVLLLKFEMLGCLLGFVFWSLVLGKQANGKK